MKITVHAAILGHPTNNEKKVTSTDSRVGMPFGKYEITALVGKGGMGENP